jgi:hypothetical protein
MATIIIENVPDVIIQKYWKKIEYSKKIKFPRYERNYDNLDEQAFDEAVKSKKIRGKLNLLAWIL